jgi:hypothetical protein
MDTLKLGLSAVDEITPPISVSYGCQYFTDSLMPARVQALCESLNKHGSLAADFEPKVRIQTWCVDS